MGAQQWPLRTFCGFDTTPSIMSLMLALSLLFALSAQAEETSAGIPPMSTKSCSLLGGSAMMGLASSLEAGLVLRSKMPLLSSDGMRSAVFAASDALLTLQGARATSAKTGPLPFPRAGLQRSIAPKLLEILYSPAVFLALCRHRATCQCTCCAIRTLAEGGAKLWDRGSNDAFELDLAGAKRLLGKIMVSQDTTVLVLGGNQWGLVWKDTSSRVPLPDLIDFYQYPGTR
jgi:hypothetical protein